jgi:putative aldouronate transport system substrate-binding protein
MVGFNFDSTPVRVEYANMMAEYTSSILPIKVGVLPYEKNFQAALAKMKAAGSDVVIAEYRKQLAEYIANRK